MNTLFAPLQQNALRVCGMVVACTMTAGLLNAQSSGPRVTARITAEITNSQPSMIQGSLHPLAQPQNDAGRMPASTRINGISLYFNRTAAQQADLDTLLAAQQNPSSPNYHQWLTPEQFAARFGMAQPDIDKVQNWLQQQGFAVDSVARGRTMIRFSGSVGQVESAFSTQMHYYNVRGVQHFAPSSALSVPAAIAPVVAGIRNLNDFRPRSQVIKPRGAFTSGQTGNVYFSPGDIATAYDIGPLTSGGINGTGQSIAIVGQSSIQLSDIENFQSAAGLTKKDPVEVLVPGTGEPATSAGDEGESDIDLEWSGAMAPGANIVFVYVGATTTFSVFDSMQYAIDEKIAPIISMSYASCEPELAATDFTALESMFSQAAVQGQSVFAASGDQGSTACSDPLNTNIPVATQEALAVSYPASSAYVTAVGGTEISASDGIDPTTGNKGANYSTYWNSSGSDIVSSLKTYIPEVVWNDDVLSGSVSASQGGGLSATGGGASIAIARPSWQAGVPGIPSGSKRLVPDVALYSSPDLPGYLLCTSDSTDWVSSTQTASCGSGFRASSSDNTLTFAGGTSFASPIFAGMLALINQKANYTTGYGLINIELYKLAANSSTYATAFQDVTSGNNFCTAGSAFCASGGATLGFKAGTGYDEVTGLGSVDLDKLASAWPANTGTSASLMGTTVTVVPANASPTVNTADTFTITVAPVSGSGTPTGTVTLQIDGGTDCGGVATTCGGTTLTNQALSANGTLTYSATFTTSGSHQVLAQYTGDATFAASVGAGEVTIGSTSSGKGKIALGATPSTLTVSQGTSGNETLTVTPSGGYTGTVDLNFTTSNDTALANLCFSFTTMTSSGQGTLAVTGTSAVTTQLTLDTNASDCATTAVAKPGMRPLRALLNRNVGRGPAPQPAPSRLPAETAFAALLLAGFLGRYARRFRAAAWILILAAAGFALSACGSSTSTTLKDPSKGTYTINVTGADSTTSTITSNTSFTFTID
jgi:subtilase family serine protease